MKGTEIVLQMPRRGVETEATIDDTSKPGTLMEVVPATAYTGGRPHVRARSQTAGVAGPICVLLPDRLQGKLHSDAYVSGTKCFLYWPLPGEELNLLLGDVTGTGDIVTQGDLFGVNNNGKIKADSTYASAPFQANETLAALTADAWVWVTFLGHTAG